VCEDKRSATLDAGNVKLTFNSLQEKAEAKERERIKEELRKGKKLETAFRNLLNERSVGEESTWEDVRGNLEGDAAFEAIAQEYERVRIFKEFIKDLEETCGHNHGRPKKTKKSKKEKKKSKQLDSSASSADSEEEVVPVKETSKRKKKKRKYSSSESSESEVEKYSKSSSKKSSKKSSSSSSRRARSRSASAALVGGGESPISSDSLSPPPPPPPKEKKRKTKKHRSRSSPSPERRVIAPPAPQNRESDESMEEGELSEDELMQKRRELLDKLRESD